MTRDETIALFNECEAARRQALDAGADEAEAHEAAKAIWNAWAEPLAAEREALEKAEKRQVSPSFDERGRFKTIGGTAETRRVLERAEADFSSLRFVTRANAEREPEGSESDNSADGVVKSIYCESLRADFSGYVFPGNAWFSSATFTGNAWFSSATFTGDAWFDRATFTGDASFNSATFTGDASFDSATFTGIASFNSATFTGNAWFSSATFTGDAWFDRATFTGDASFTSATFTGDAWFGSATFTGDASFTSATFTGDAWFHQANFDGYSTFNSSVFAGAARFGAIDAKRTFDLADATFENDVPNFIQAHFSEAPRLDNIRVPKGRIWQGARDKDEAARYQALKRLAIQGHDHVREQEFFAGELRARRFDLARRSELKEAGYADLGLLFFSSLRPEALWSFPYDVLSGYGRSILRPLGLIAASLVLFAAIYASISGAHRLEDGLARLKETVGADNAPALGNAAVAIDTCGAPYRRALTIALKNGLLFLGGGQKTEVETAYKCLYGNFDGEGKLQPGELPAAVGEWGFFQGIVSAVLIFLALLGLRNLFRIK